MQRFFRIAYPMHGFYTAFMTDHLTPEKRSWNMGRIKAKNTKPELLLRSALHRAGYRFRIHVKTLPGTPDIVLPKKETLPFAAEMRENYGATERTKESNQEQPAVMNF